MTDTDQFSKREIENFFSQIEDKLNEMKIDHLIPIKNQVFQTNGRVSSLERWRAFITGGLAILTLMVAPILLSIIIKWLKL